MQQEISKGAVLEAMRKELGKESAPGEWFVVDQTLINNFVDISGETGWLHLDVERAAKSKFGGLSLPATSASRGRSEPAISHPLSRKTPNQGCIDRYSIHCWLFRIRSRSRLLEWIASDGHASPVEFGSIEGRTKSWVTGVKVGRFFYD